jgi:hypothetical protein
VNLIAHSKKQYAPHGSFEILKIKAQDYRLKSCMVGQKCNNNITGRNHRGIVGN